MDEQQKNQLVGIGIIVGFISMAGAIFALFRTDRGKKAKLKASQYASKATGVASDYMETRRGAKSHEATDWGRYLYEAWGQMKGRGRIIEHIDVHLEDGTSYRLRADKLEESVKRELIGRADQL